MKSRAAMPNRKIQSSRRKITRASLASSSSGTAVGPFSDRTRKPTAGDRLMRCGQERQNTGCPAGSNFCCCISRFDFDPARPAEPSKGSSLGGQLVHPLQVGTTATTNIGALGVDQRPAHDPPLLAGQQDRVEHEQESSGAGYYISGHLWAGKIPNRRSVRALCSSCRRRSALICIEGALSRVARKASCPTFVQI